MMQTRVLYELPVRASPFSDPKAGSAIDGLASHAEVRQNRDGSLVVSLRPDLAADRLVVVLVPHGRTAGDRDASRVEHLAIRRVRQSRVRA